MPRNKNKGKRLPQQKMITKIVFEKDDKRVEVPCLANIALNGKTVDTLSEEEKKEKAFITSECVHPIWPTFMPQCKECIAKNLKITNRYLIDRKGRHYKDLTWKTNQASQNTKK